VALTERAAADILARQADGIIVDEQRAEGERLSGRPIEALTAFEHSALGLEDTRQRLVDHETIGDGGELGGDLVECLSRHAARGGAALAYGFARRCKSGPFAFKPVGLVGLVALARLEFAFEVGDEIALGLSSQPGSIWPCRDQAIGIELRHGGCLRISSYITAV